MKNFQIVDSKSHLSSKNSVEGHRQGVCQLCQTEAWVGDLFEWFRDRQTESWDFEQTVICEDCLRGLDRYEVAH